MKYGFTGTFRGMDKTQFREVMKFMEENPPTEIHHGDCVGADYDFVRMTLTYFPNVKVICHPPDNPKKRAWAVSHEYRPEKKYLSRNMDIVIEGEDLLMACPGEHNEVLRSGTWATIRYAKKLNRETKIFYRKKAYY